MKPVLFLLLVLACMTGVVLSQDRDSPEWKKDQEDLAKWCRLNLGPAWGGRCRRNAQKS